MSAFRVVRLVPALLVATLAACSVERRVPTSDTTTAAIGPDGEPSGPWLRSAGVGEMSAAYFVIPNAGADTLRITGVEVDAAESASLHRTIDSAGTVRMVAQDTLTIAPGDSAVLAPRGLHVMLHGMRVPAAPGDTIVIRLFSTRADTLTVRAAVRP
jgi:hypothetical protein